VKELVGQGKTLQEVLAAKVTAPYDAKVPSGRLPAGAAGTNADRFVSMVYAPKMRARLLDRVERCRLTRSKPDAVESSRRSVP